MLGTVVRRIELGLILLEIYSLKKLVFFMAAVLYICSSGLFCLIIEHGRTPMMNLVNMVGLLAVGHGYLWLNWKLV